MEIHDSECNGSIRFLLLLGLGSKAGLSYFRRCATSLAFHLCCSRVIDAYVRRVCEEECGRMNGESECVRRVCDECVMSV